MTDDAGAFPVTGHLLLGVDGRWLILRRARPPERWELPGGRARPGESPADAAVRETDEEIGLRVRAGRLLAVAYIAPSRPSRPGRVSFIFAAAAPLLPRQTANIRLDGVEVDRWELLPHRQALVRLHPLLAARLRTAAQRRGGGHYLEQHPLTTPADVA